MHWLAFISEIKEQNKNNSKFKYKKSKSKTIIFIILILILILLLLLLIIIIIIIIIICDKIRSISMQNVKTIAVENQILGRGFSELLPFQIFIDRVND